MLSTGALSCSKIPTIFCSPFYFIFFFIKLTTDIYTMKIRSIFLFLAFILLMIDVVNSKKCSTLKDVQYTGKQVKLVQFYYKANTDGTLEKARKLFLSPKRFVMYTLLKLTDSKSNLVSPLKNSSQLKSGEQLV